MFIMTWVCNRNIEGGNQSAVVRLMLDPSGLKCWNQLVTLGSLNLLTPRHDVARPQVLH